VNPQSTAIALTAWLLAARFRNAKRVNSAALTALNLPRRSESSRRPAFEGCTPSEDARWSSRRAIAPTSASSRTSAHKVIISSSSVALDGPSNPARCRPSLFDASAHPVRIARKYISARTDRSKIAWSPLLGPSILQVDPATAVKSRRGPSGAPPPFCRRLEGANREGIRPLLTRFDDKIHLRRR
jgi:hypothetical protein